MGKRPVAVLILLLLLAILVWQLPALVKAIPSRYVAAYFPAPIQALAAREHEETLPTVAISRNAIDLLKENPSPIQTKGASLLIEKPAPAAEPTHTPVAIKTSPGQTPIVNSDEQTSNVTAISTKPPSPGPEPSPTSTSVPFPSNSRLPSVRHHFQTWNNCGPATLAMGLSFFDLFVTQEQTASFLKPDPEDRNVSPWEMAAFVNEQTELSALDRTNGDLDTLRRLISGGFPVIVELGIDPPGEYRWMGWYGHYLLVVAYDDNSQQVWVYDLWFGTRVPAENADDEGRQVDYEELDNYWRQFNRNYTVLFHPNQAAEVAMIIGSDMDDETMWQRSLAVAKDEAIDEPENAFLWFNLGTIFNALGDHEKAAMSFDQARAIGLPWRMLWYQFGPYEAYAQVGRYDDVILLADVTLKDRPYFEESYYYRALAYAALGQEKEARTDLERATRFNPRYAPAAELLQQLDLADSDKSS